MVLAIPFNLQWELALIGYPDSLVGLYRHNVMLPLAGLPTDKVKPLLIVDKIYIGQMHKLSLKANITDAEDTLLAIHALTPKPE